MKDKLTQAKIITGRFNYHGCKVALDLILSGVPTLDALNYAREHYSNTESHEKQLKAIERDADFANYINKEEIRLHIRMGNNWSTVKLHPTRAVRYAKRAFSDGASEIKVY